MLGSVPWPMTIPPTSSAIQKNSPSRMLTTSAGFDGGPEQDAHGDEAAGDGEHNGDLGAALAGQAGHPVHERDDPCGPTVGGREDLRDRVRRPLSGSSRK